MLLPSILRMLNQNDTLWIPAETKAGRPETLGLHRIEIEIAAAADLAKAPGAAAQNPGAPAQGPFLEELIRAINKFEKSEEPKVVDVFE